MMIMIIVVLFLMYYFPSNTCIHRRENMILSEILSFMRTLLWCGKITNTHTHIRTTTGLFQFFNKKTEKQEKKRKKTTICRRRYYLLLPLGRASERTGWVKQQKEKLGGLVVATERKSLHVYGSNRVREKAKKKKSDVST